MTNSSKYSLFLRNTPYTNYIMRKYCILYFLCLPLFYSWGFYAHKKINNAAVFTLPAQLARFYKIHLNTITEKAVDADKRCYIDTLESPRHYIDLNDYPDSLGAIPIHWRDAKEKYEERQLRARGIIPWQIYLSYQKLVKAFQEKEYDAIIRYSADLGHYIADAHVPLHTTSNYNGQFTGQIGIHAFWESRLPEMFADKYNLFVGKAQYIASPLDTAWAIVRESNDRVDFVLSAEKELSQTFPKHQQKSYITRNNTLVFTQSDAYAKTYHDYLGGMVEQRMRESIRRIGSFWLSAWIDAGQPKLKIHSLNEKPAVKDEEHKKIIGRPEWH
ncbi:zinc dependent phospholipase C family protein [Sphingobacterium sp. LRF_L2]|uniref:zinc dependent phospholipase C family protein n=1 Tax=Sphingobacterium sp. LRF_L2 TaxID=3369421 RepID=UPI003F5E699F